MAFVKLSDRLKDGNGGKQVMSGSRPSVALGTTLHFVAVTAAAT
jgi:hypothetical protein